jgi:hypothetical protein
LKPSCKPPDPLQNDWVLTTASFAIPRWVEWWDMPIIYWPCLLFWINCQMSMFQKWQWSPNWVVLWDLNFRMFVYEMSWPMMTCDMTQDVPTPSWIVSAKWCGLLAVLMS